MIDNEILNTFKTVNEKFYGNSNSLHKLGLEAKKMEKFSSEKILNTLNLSNKEIIYTSSISEAKALAVLGYLHKYQNKNKSIFVPENELDFYKTLLKDFVNEGLIIKTLNKNKIDKDTVLIILSDDYTIDSNFVNTPILVTITNIDKIKDYKQASFIVIDAKVVNALEGITVLIKNKNIIIEKLFHGGKSSTIYRSGTPAIPFIAAFSKAITLMYKNNK